MPGFFEALSNRQEPLKKIYTVTVEGKTLEVSHTTKLEVLKIGEENYMINPNKTGDTIILKPKKTVCFPKLSKSAEGILFQDNNPFWAVSQGKGGHTWKTE